MNPGITQRVVSRMDDGCPPRSVRDELAIEEPLEIRVAGDPVAVTMRSPGEDARLAAGFLFSEGIIGSIEDVGRVFHCGRPGTEGYGNAIDVLPAPGHSLDIERVSASRRGTLTTSACGVCGRQDVADLVARCSVLPPGPKIPATLLIESIDGMRRIQPTFAHTGGVHAAAAFDRDGRALVCSEDVGRHNAVDKTVGALLFDRLVGASSGAVLLAVSGRASFEIVQKAAVARIPVVASVSAASSLAVDLASDVGITLAGFVRRKGFNLYAHPERVAQ
ncbi:MAG: formate dehydrogenase accessory sulfurtransferase FdhD [Gemmatimonadota bacterium]|nr:formate dehydrogenase accessory sulfurtransferase FdhD [Gemmatimonadota bacterium]